MKTQFLEISLGFVTATSLRIPQIKLLTPDHKMLTVLDNYEYEQHANTMFPISISVFIFTFAFISLLKFERVLGGG